MEVQQLAEACQLDIGHAEHLIGPINAAIEQADLSTPQRLAAFLAQCGHESDSFRYLEENLNYKAESLMQVWHSHFPTPEIAQEYAHQPQRIASRAYGGRMGNGPEETGEGWLYRGSGWLQLTGKDNFHALSQHTGIDFVSNPDAVRTPEGAAVSAVYFWNKHNLNQLADEGNIAQMTHVINGGTIGLENREARYQHALNILSQS